MPKAPLWTKPQVEFLRTWMATAPASSTFIAADLEHLATIGPPRTKAAAEAKVKSLRTVDALRRERPPKAPKALKLPKATKIAKVAPVAPQADLGLLLAITGVDPETLEAALGRAWVLGHLPDGFTRDQGLGLIERARKAYEELA